jgi:hypothetical protein
VLVRLLLVFPNLRRGKAKNKERRNEQEWFHIG